MAITTNTHTATANQTDFAVTFEYIEQNDVFVTVNEVAQANPAQWTFFNATTIRFGTGLNAGDKVLIYRRTDEDLLEARFLPGSAIRAKDLNANDEQLLFLIQETQTAIKAIQGDNDSGELPPPEPGEGVDLDDLGDVVITGAANGQIIEYNGTNWVNVANTDTLSELTDTTITSPANGQVLEYNGSKWVNVDNTDTLSELTDTNITSPQNNNILEYNNATSKWVNTTWNQANWAETTSTEPSFIQNKPVIEPAPVFLGTRDCVANGPAGTETANDTYENTTTGNLAAGWGLGGSVASAPGCKLVLAADGVNWTHVTVGVSTITGGTNIGITGASITPTVNLNITANQNSSATGYFQIAQGTSANRPAVGDYENGQIRYNTDLNRYEGISTVSVGGVAAKTWGSLGGAAKGGGDNQIFLENDQAVTSDYEITANKNAMTAGPITINTGVTVTIPATSNWTIV